MDEQMRLEQMIALIKKVQIFGYRWEVPGVGQNHEELVQMVRKRQAFEQIQDKTFS